MAVVLGFGLHALSKGFQNSAPGLRMHGINRKRMLCRVDTQWLTHVVRRCEPRALFIEWTTTTMMDYRFRLPWSPDRLAKQLRSTRFCETCLSFPVPVEDDSDMTRFWHWFLTEMCTLKTRVCLIYSLVLLGLAIPLPWYPSIIFVIKYTWISLHVASF